MIPSTKRAKLISGEKSSPEGLPLSPASEVKRAKRISGEKSSPEGLPLSPASEVKRAKRISGEKSSPEGLPLSPASEVKAFEDMPVPVQYLRYEADSDEDRDVLAQWQFSPEIRKVRVKPPQRVKIDPDYHSSESSQEEIESSHKKPTHGVGKSLAALEELRKKNEVKPRHGVGKSLAALEELRKKNEVSQEISHHGVGKQLSMSALKKLLKNQSSSSQHDDHSSQASIHDRELLRHPVKAEIMDSKPEEQEESEKLALIYFYLREAENRTSDASKLLREVNPRSLDKTTMECEMIAATENLKRASTLAHAAKKSLL